jgi:hypothetical protein
MAFVKVVGGSKIYNFRIQSFVHFYSKLWSFSGSSTSTSTRCRPERRLGVRASAAPPEATRRLRSRLPQAPAPRGSLKSSRAARRRRLRRTDRVRATDCRSVCGAPPYARRPRPPYHGGISAVTVTSPARHPPYKYRSFSPSRRHRRSIAPSVSPPSSCDPTASHGRATILAPSLGSVGPPRVTCCPGRAIAVAGAEPPRPPLPTLVVRPRWRLLRPNFGHPQALGERAVELHYLTGRERRRLAGIRTEPPPPHAKDPIASPQIFPGSQPQTRGISVKVGKVLGTSLQKRNFNSKTLLLILVKSLENRRTIGKCKLNFARLLVMSTTTFVKLV